MNNLDVGSLRDRAQWAIRALPLTRTDLAELRSADSALGELVARGADVAEVAAAADVVARRLSMALHPSRGTKVAETPPSVLRAHEAMARIGR